MSSIISRLTLRTVDVLSRALDARALTSDDWAHLGRLGLALYALNVVTHAVFHAKRNPMYLETGKGRVIVLARVAYGLPAAMAQGAWIALWIVFWEAARSPLWRPRRKHHGDLGARRKRARTPVVHDGHASVALCLSLIHISEPTRPY